MLQVPCLDPRIETGAVATLHTSTLTGKETLLCIWVSFLNALQSTEADALDPSLFSIWGNSHRLPICMEYFPNMMLSGNIQLVSLLAQDNVNKSHSKKTFVLRGWAGEKDMWRTKEGKLHPYFNFFPLPTTYAQLQACSLSRPEDVHPWKLLIKVQSACYRNT